MAANVIVEMSGNEQKLLLSMRRVIAEQGKMEGGFAKVGASAAKAGGGRGAAAPGGGFAALAGMIGPQVLGAVAGLTGGLLSVSRILGDIDQQSERAKEALSQAALPRAALAQLADTPEQFERLQRAARSIAQMTGMSMTDAANFVFELESAGMMQHAAMFARLRASGVVADPSIMVRAMQTMRTALGEAETGTLPQLLGKIFEAGKISPGTAEQVAEATSQTAAMGKMLGLRDEELLAAVAVLSKSTGGAVEAATQITGMLKAFNEDVSFQGLRLVDMIRRVTEMGLGSAELQKWFGRVEGLKGWSALDQNLGALARAIEQVTAAADQNLADVKTRQVMRVPEVAAPLLAAQAKQMREAVEAPYGVQRALTDALIDEMMAMYYAPGGGPTGVPGFDRAIGAGMEAVLRLQRWVGGDVEFAGEYAGRRPEPAWDAMPRNPDVGEIAQMAGTGAKSLERAAEMLAEAARHLLGRDRTLGGPDADPAGVGSSGRAH